MKKLLGVIGMIVMLHSIAIAQLDVDTSTLVYSWKLNENFDEMQRVQVDTSLAFFQQYDPAQLQYASYSALGNYSLPAQSHLFTERDHNGEYIFVNPFFPYMKLYWQTNYINTRTPFTQLMYTNGGSSQNKLEILDAFHTQNISNIFNAGLHLTTARSRGQYQFQQTRNNSFRLFSSYSGNKYTAYFNLNFNKIIADENGGIPDDGLIMDTVYTFTKDIPVLFGGIDNPPAHEPDVYNEIRNLSAFTMHELSLRSNDVPADSTSREGGMRIFYPKVAYIFHFDRYVRLFHDKNPAVGLENGIYPDVLINEMITSDSMLYWNMYNGLRLKFQGRQNNHYFAEYGYEIKNYGINIPSEDPGSDSLLQNWFISQDISLPTIHYVNALYNSHITTGFSRLFANHLDLDVTGQYFVSGYRQGDYSLSGSLSLFTGRSDSINQLVIAAKQDYKSPDFLMTHYASNNFIWTKNFRKTLFNHLSINFGISSKKFQLKGDYYLIRDFIYFNEMAIPDQLHDNMSVTVLSLSKQFDFWKITSRNRIAWQTVSNETVLDLPEFVFASSTYLRHMFNFNVTGGQLLTMVGFDLKYNSAYYANAYMPPLSSFYRQRTKRLGNYPYVDVFLNVQLKRVRFFMKYDHVNSGWTDRNYFTVLHYPMKERNLNFGLSWTFYD